MLPVAPPHPRGADFDPATISLDEDVEMETEESHSRTELSTVEINILIYLYMLESNFQHSAFSFLHESNLPSTSLFQHFNPAYPLNPLKDRSVKPNGVTPGEKGKNSPAVPMFGQSEGKVPRGELINRLWKGLRWEEVERHIAPNGEPYKPNCPNPFHLLIPHVCPPSYPSSALNPALPIPSTMRLSPPPSKRPEAFPPPPEEPIAGPSRSRALSDSRQNTNSNATSAASEVVKGKRKVRRDSNASAESRNASPTRSTSPAKGKRAEKEKKRARVSEGSTSTKMDVDDEPKKKGKGLLVNGRKDSPKSEKAELEVPGTDRRSKSPAAPRGKGKEKAGAKSTGNSLWIEDAHISSWSEHRDVVSCLAWNPKNRDVLATASSDGTARLWDFHSDDSLPPTALSLSKKPTVIHHKSIESSKKIVTALSWHPDGTVLATGCQDGVGRLFTPSGQLQGIMSYGRGSINSMKFNPSGSMILAAKNDFTVCLFTIGNSYNQPMTRCFESHTKEVNDVDWLDDHVFASGGNDHTIFVHRANDKRPRFTFKGHTDDVTKVKWSPARPGHGTESRLLASVADDGNIMIWKLPAYPDDRGTGSNSRSTSPQKQNHKDSSEDDYFGEGKWFGGIEHCVQKLQVVSGDMENKRMDTLDWSPMCKDGRMIVAAGGQDSTVVLFDALSGERLHTLSGLEAGTGSIAFSPPEFGGALGAVAGGGWNGQLFIWDVENGKKLKEYEVDEEPAKQAGRDKPMMLSMEWRDDGKQIGLGLHNKTVMTVYVGDLQVKADKGKAKA
ncbi:WD40-repeat-containing domain protein [Naematelia encephala]|uniref:WD40-repeat-containing domain protein n=1 Tax=Naematelia encephala TaxID=71784 RepID=A0A1Y2AZH4_9TREE|nr:WD40-repeat-containing domain protein [Naematelia encephala]